MAGNAEKVIVEAKANNIINNDVRSGIGKEEKADEADITIEVDAIEFDDNES